jgi:hypothetical protein
MEQILAQLLTEMNVMREKMDSSQERMEAKTDAYQEKMEDGQVEIKDQVGSLAFRIDANQEEMKARVNAIKYKKEITIKCRQEETEATIQSIRSELQEIITHPVEDVLACVDQRTQDLCKELKEKIYEMQVDLQPVKTPIDKWTVSLKDDITDAKKDFQELGLMIQGQAQMTKP